MNDTLPWIKKYLPQTTKEVVGQEGPLQQMRNFLMNFKQQKKKALMLYGKCGVGKTCSVHALAHELQLEILEVNASDVRNEEAISSILGNATKQMSLFSRGKVILVDEIDGVSGKEDRGGITALATVIQQTKFPIIATAENPFDKKYTPLRKEAQLIEFSDLSYVTVFHKLKEICEKENVVYEESALKSLSRQVGGDLRAAINDLQVLSLSVGTQGRKLTQETLQNLQHRRQTESMPQALVKVFKVRDPAIALTAFDDVDEDIGQQLLWIDENLPKEYTHPEDLARAYEALSKADVFQGRIRRWQYWRFLVYVGALISAGVAMAKNERSKQFVQYTRTERFLTLWKANMKYKQREAIAEKIASSTHTSLSYALRETLPFFKYLFEKNASIGHALAAELKLDPDEISWLRQKH